MNFEGRPRKLVRDHTYQIPGGGTSEGTEQGDKEGQSAQAGSEGVTEEGRGKRKIKGIIFDEGVDMKTN